MRAVTTAGLIAAIGIAACGRVFVESRNELVSEQETVLRELVDLEGAIGRRADLIPNLSAALKGYVAEETGVFTALAQARVAMTNARTALEMFDANTQLGAALGKLFVAIETNPKAKSNENFVQLQRELEGTDNRILQARRRYNDALKRYNTDLARTPGNLVGPLCGLQRDDTYFKTEPFAPAAPKVQF